MKFNLQSLDDSKIVSDLPDRAWFKKNIATAIARVQRDCNYQFAVLFLDLDRFRTINHSLGYAVGDRLLFNVTHRLLKSVRTIDTVARLGGDEFAILLENIQNPYEVDTIAQRISKELREPFNILGQEVYTDVSIGIVFSSIGYYYVADLLRDADIALYRAKAKGKGRYEVFNFAMRDRAIAISQLETDLQRAIERDEIEVYYQPIFSLEGRKIKSFEALMRWHHPEKGLISPAEFIPIAEEIGSIVCLDLWVLQQACRQIKIWQEQYPDASPFRVSVNLSGQHFKQPNLIEKTEQILKETSLESRCLELEIVESDLIDNLELATVVLEQLKELGVGLSLDDFGTGYSSLSYLHRFPVDKIKIDRSFISRIDTQQDSLEIVRAIVTLGQSLGINLIAEGIETQKQLALLQQLQCQYGQGYFFSKPLSASQGDALLKSLTLS